jgi:hypothetical protein
MTERTTRRGFLRIGATVATTGALAGLSGCSSVPGVGDGGDGDGGSENTLDVVPADVTAVAYMDVGGMLEDGAVEQLMNKLLELAAEEEGYAGPTTTAEWIQQIQDQTDLDPTQMEEAITFGKAPDVSGGMTRTPSPGDQYGGMWFTTGWSEDDLVGVMSQQGTQFEEGEYEGHTIYEPTSEFGQTWLGVIEEGEFVLGTEDAVKETIDVADGNMDSVGSDLRDAYSSVRSGLWKVATTVPEDNLPDESTNAGGVEFDPARIAQVDSGAAVGYHDGDQVGMEAAMTAQDSDAAEDVRDILAGARAAAESAVESDELAAELDAVSVEQDGESITIGYENSTDAAVELLGTIVEELRAMQPGSGEQSMAIETAG